MSDVPSRGLIYYGALYMSGAATLVYACLLLGQLYSRDIPLCLAFAIIGFLSCRTYSHAVDSDALPESGLHDAYMVATVLLLPFYVAIPAIGLGFAAYMIGEQSIRRVAQPLGRRVTNVFVFTLIASTCSLFINLVGIHNGLPASSLSQLTTALVVVIAILCQNVLKDVLMFPIYSILHQVKLRSFVFGRPEAHILGLGGTLIGAGLAISWRVESILCAIFFVLLVVQRLALEGIAATTAAEGLSQHNNHMATIIELSQNMSITDPVEGVARPLARGVQALTNADIVQVYLADEEDVEILQPAVAVGQAGRILTSLPGIYSYTIEMDTDVDEDNHRLRLALRGQDNVLIGAVEARGCRTIFDETLISSIGVLRNQAASGLDRVRLYQNMEQLATAMENLAAEDALTNLANRRVFTRRLNEAISQMHQTGEPLAVVIIDLDNFGSINNTHGHAVGDAALTTVARVMQNITRVSDVAARLGGDEFALILQSTSKEEALVIAHRVLKGLHATPIVHDSGALYVSASIGVAIAPDDGQSSRDLLAAADTAAYWSKRMGKDRVGTMSDAAAQPGTYVKRSSIAT